MDLTLNGKRALVCGSTDGIGKASALLMAERGAEIVLMARNQVKLEKVREELAFQNNQNHQIICADFNDIPLLQNVLSSELSEPIDILVNNSGGPHGGPLIEAEPDEFRIGFERLLVSNQVITKAVVPSMQTRGFGRIINIISISVNQVIPGLGVSNTIRGAVSQWAKTLALELGSDGITVNNVLPGYTATNRLEELVEAKAETLDVSRDQIKAEWAGNTTLRRLGEPIEIAKGVAFLASECAGYINGYNLSIDGGRFGT